MASKADKIAEQLLDSSRIIAESMIRNLAYDKTYKATVVGTNRAGVGLYSCKLDDLTFTAVGAINEYKVNDIVQVNVPQDNWDNQKNIIGRGYVSSSASEAKLPFDDFYIPEDADPIPAILDGEGQEIGLLANQEVYNLYPPSSFVPSPDHARETKETIAIFNIVPDIMSYYKDAYTCLGVKANFSTKELVNFPVIEGNYGLRIKFFSSSTAVDPIAIYELNTLNMIGNIYALQDFTEFQAVFKPDPRVINNAKVVSLELFENGRFYYSNDLVERTFLEYTNGTFNPNSEDINDRRAAPPEGNIHINNVRFYWGYDVNDFENDQLLLSTSSDSFYYAHYDNTKHDSNPRSVKNFTYSYLKKDQNGKVTRVPNPEVTFYKKYGNNDWFKLAGPLQNPNRQYTDTLSVTEMQSTSDSISYKITTPKEEQNEETGERYTYIESNVITFYKYDDGSEDSQSNVGHNEDGTQDDSSGNGGDVDLSGYVTTTTEIANIEIQDGISAEDLRAALGIQLANGEGYITQALRVYRIMKNPQGQTAGYDPMYGAVEQKPLVYAFITYYSLGSAVYGNITIEVENQTGGPAGKDFSLRARHYSEVPGCDDSYRDTLVIVAAGDPLDPNTEPEHTKFVAYPYDETPSPENQKDFPTPGQSVFYAQGQYSIGPGVVGDAGLKDVHGEEPSPHDIDYIRVVGGVDDFRLVGDLNTENIMSIEGYLWGELGPKHIDQILINRPFTYTTSDEGYIGIGDNHHNTKMTGYIAHNVGSDKISGHSVSFGDNNTVKTAVDEETSGFQAISAIGLNNQNYGANGTVVIGANNVHNYFKDSTYNASSSALITGTNNYTRQFRGIISGHSNLSISLNDTFDSTTNCIGAGNYLASNGASVHGEFNSTYENSIYVCGHYNNIFTKHYNIVRDQNSFGAYTLIPYTDLTTLVFQEPTLYKDYDANFGYYKLYKDTNKTEEFTWEDVGGDSYTQQAFIAKRITFATSSAKAYSNETDSSGIVVKKSVIIEGQEKIEQDLYTSGPKPNYGSNNSVAAVVYGGRNSIYQSGVRGGNSGHVATFISGGSNTIINPVQDNVFGHHNTILNTPGAIGFNDHFTFIIGGVNKVKSWYYSNAGGFVIGQGNLGLGMSDSSFVIGTSNKLYRPTGDSGHLTIGQGNTIIKDNGVLIGNANTIYGLGSNSQSNLGIGYQNKFFNIKGTFSLGEYNVNYKSDFSQNIGYNNSVGLKKAINSSIPYWSGLTYAYFYDTSSRKNYLVNATGDIDLKNMSNDGDFTEASPNEGALGQVIKGTYSNGVFTEVHPAVQYLGKWNSTSQDWDYVDEIPDYDSESNTIFGGYNVTTASSPTAIGICNEVHGDNSTVIGKYNKVVGVGNYVNGYTNKVGDNEPSYYVCKELLQNTLTTGYFNPFNSLFYADADFNTPMIGDANLRYQDDTIYADGQKSTIPYKYNTNTQKWEVDIDYQEEENGHSIYRFGSGKYNTIFGVGNTTRYTGLNFISGTNNLINDSSYLNAIFGSNNNILYSSRNCFVEGEQNILGANGYCTHLGGTGNTIGSYSNSNLITGSSNTIGISSGYSIITGVQNTVGDGVSSVFISGQYNNIGNGASKVFVSGNNITIPSGYSDLTVFGYYPDIVWSAQRYLLVIGNGNSTTHSNAFAVYTDGTVQAGNNVEINGTPSAANHAVTLSILNKVLNNFADPYDSTSFYNVGDLVIYDYTLYQCTTAIVTPEAFDSTKWQHVKVNQITTPTSQYPNAEGNQF